eukprot:976121-Rhodomonas_salina.1
MEVSEAEALYTRAFELSPSRLEFRNALAQFANNKSALLSPHSFLPETCSVSECERRRVRLAGGGVRGACRAVCAGGNG